MSDLHQTTPNPATREVARSFYDELSSQGFTADEVVDLATSLLDLVHTELANTPRPAQRRDDLPRS